MNTEETMERWAWVELVYNDNELTPNSYKVTKSSRAAELRAHQVEYKGSKLEGKHFLVVYLSGASAPEKGNLEFKKGEHQGCIKLECAETEYDLTKIEKVGVSVK